MDKDLMITKQDLIDWIDRIPSNNDLDLATFISKRLEIFYDLEQQLQQKEDKIKKLQEENLLLRASEPMSKLVDDYGYKAKNEEAIKLIKKWRVNPTSYFENMRGSLIVPKVETDRLLKLLGDMENE